MFTLVGVVATGLVSAFGIKLNRFVGERIFLCCDKALFGCSLGGSQIVLGEEDERDLLTVSELLLLDDLLWTGGVFVLQDGITSSCSERGGAALLGSEEYLIYNILYTI